MKTIELNGRKLEYYEDAWKPHLPWPYKTGQRTLLLADKKLILYLTAPRDPGDRSDRDQDFRANPIVTIIGAEPAFGAKLAGKVICENGRQYDCQYNLEPLDRDEELFVLQKHNAASQKQLLEIARADGEQTRKAIKAVDGTTDKILKHTAALPKIVQADGEQTRKEVKALDIKTDRLLANTTTLKDMAVEEAASRDKWRENPLCCQDAMRDYLLTMDALKIKSTVALALLGHGYGNTYAACAKEAGKSEATIKRALRKARNTDYAKFFAKTRTQKLQARKAIKKLDEAWSCIRRMAEDNPDELRAQVEQVIELAQKDDGAE